MRASTASSTLACSLREFIAARFAARAVCDGRISFDRSTGADTVIARLSEIPGFSDFAVQYVAMRALREPDAFPFVERELMRILGLGSGAQIERRSRDWRPWRAYAAAYLCEASRSGESQPMRRGAAIVRPAPARNCGARTAGSTARQRIEF